MRVLQQQTRHTVWDKQRSPSALHSPNIWKGHENTASTGCLANYKTIDSYYECFVAKDAFRS